MISWKLTKGVDAKSCQRVQKTSCWVWVLSFFCGLCCISFSIERVLFMRSSTDDHKWVGEARGLTVKEMVLVWVPCLCVLPDLLQLLSQPGGEGLPQPVQQLGQLHIVVSVVAWQKCSRLRRVRKKQQLGDGNWPAGRSGELPGGALDRVVNLLSFKAHSKFLIFLQVSSQQK